MHSAKYVNIYNRHINLIQSPTMSLHMLRCHSSHLSRSLNSDGSRSAAMISLGRKDHVVMSTQLLADFSPGIKVVLGCDSAANTFSSPDAPELLEGRSSIDTWLVGACRLVDIIGAPVTLDRTLLASTRGRVVGAVALDDVILDERVACPAVERDIRVYARCVPGSGVVYDLGTSWVPALAGHEVSDVVPGYAVLAAIFVVVGYRALIIRPE